jgi:hypothetical protein
MCTRANGHDVTVAHLRAQAKDMTRSLYLALPSSLEFRLQPAGFNKNLLSDLIVLS